jgi:beta-glucanase (GH16 family)
MKNLILITSILLFLFSCKEQKDNLIWSDEFNYTGLPDSTKWGNEVGYIRNNELQFYTNRRLENSVVKDGYLMIIGRKEPWENYNYTSASINTHHKFSFRYGKIEARMRLPVGQGIWPAFWMMGESRGPQRWPKCGEIDIMEHINNTLKLVGTAHWHNEKHVSSGTQIPCDVTQFHNYALEWDQDSLRWLLDDKRYHALCIKDSINSTGEFHKPFYILLNMAIGGNWPKNPDSTTVFPDTVFVDYVRVFRNLPQ